MLELDGGQHSENVRDEVRTAYLVENGYSVLRFWNNEILTERRAVLDTILAALEGHLAPSSGLRFAQSTFSPRGEEAANPDRLAP